ncbi:hypothetical protein V8G54_016520, partial [Vigna mungo]
VRTTLSLFICTSFFATSCWSCCHFFLFSFASLPLSCLYSFNVLAERNVLSGDFHAFLRSLGIRSLLVYIVRGEWIWFVDLFSLLLLLFCGFLMPSFSYGGVHLVGIGILFNFHVLLQNVLV